jgi:hypothetical protein
MRGGATLGCARCFASALFGPLLPSKLLFPQEAAGLLGLPPLGGSSPNEHGACPEDSTLSRHREFGEEAEQLETAGCRHLGMCGCLLAVIAGACRCSPLHLG